ncbi:hypothetical protein AB4254_11915 [Vibrio breoganii]
MDKLSEFVIAEYGIDAEIYCESERKVIVKNIGEPKMLTLEDISERLELSQQEVEDLMVFHWSKLISVTSYIELCQKIKLFDPYDFPS